MSINFTERTIYCKLGWDNSVSKKTTYFGKKWGQMEKAEANTVAFKTGNGLVVVDVDTLDLDEIDKALGKVLKKLKPTVKTKRGSHWYFEHKNSNEFVNDSAYTELVDVRSDGGLIFAQYRGKNENISYKKVGDVYKKMPKKLLKRLRELMKTKSKRKQNRDQWSKAPKGEIHSATLSYAAKDFFSGLSLDEVLYRGIEYVENYLNGTSREMKLMSARIKDAYDYHISNKLENTRQVSSPEPLDIGGELEDSEIRDMLVKAQKGGSLELERIMKEIKKKTKISLATLRDMLAEAQVGSDGLNGFFIGDMIWDSALNVYVEIREKNITYYSKSGFVQTVMSKSGWMTSTDVGERLCTIPHKFVVYDPSDTTGEIITKNGDEAVNVYRGMDFGDKVQKKIPKTISKILDNLFASEPLAKEEFVNWMAVIVRTGMRTGIAWGLFGASGSGKGFVADLMQKLLGYENCSMNVGDVDLQSSFNPYMHHKQFVHLNEITSDFHGRAGVAGKMKAYVSDPYIRINQKNAPEIAVNNNVNIIINSNKANPIEIDIDDRRYNMIVSEKSLTSLDWWQGDKSYQKGLKEYKKFGRYLSQYKIDIKRATSPMKTNRAKQSIIEQTTSPLQQMGYLIKKGDADKILDMLEIDSSDLVFNEEVIRNNCKTGKWCNNILKEFYIWVTGKEYLKGNEVRRYFINPHISPISSLWRIEGKVVRGVDLVKR